MYKFQVLTKKNLQELVKAVDPNEQLDEDVEEVLLNYAEDFMEGLIEGACVLARHRHGTTVDAKDVQTHLGLYSSLIFVLFSSAFKSGVVYIVILKCRLSHIL